MYKKGQNKNSTKPPAAIREISQTSSRDSSVFSNVSENKAKPVKKHACIRYLKTFLLAWDKLVLMPVRCRSAVSTYEFLKIIGNNVKCFYLLPGLSGVELFNSWNGQYRVDRSPRVNLFPLHSLNVTTSTIRVNFFNYPCLVYFDVLNIFVFISFTLNNWKSSFSYLEIRKGLRLNGLNICHCPGSDSVCLSLMTAFTVKQGVNLKLVKVIKKKLL